MSELILIFIVSVVAFCIGYVIGKLNSKKEIEDRSLIPVVIGETLARTVAVIAIHKSELMLLLKNGRSITFALQQVKFGFDNPYDWVKRFGAKILGNEISNEISIVNLYKENAK